LDNWDVAFFPEHELKGHEYSMIEPWSSETSSILSTSLGDWTGPCVNACLKRLSDGMEEEEEEHTALRADTTCWDTVLSPLDLNVTWYSYKMISTSLMTIDRLFTSSEKP
jgi:hypothetical protein